MNDEALNKEMRERRARLLWVGYTSVPKGHPFPLGAKEAHAAGYVEHFGGRDYIRVLDLDVGLLLEVDEAIEEVTQPRSQGLIDAQAHYEITERGIALLSEDDYPLP
jgi:hypothetical protein